LKVFISIDMEGVSGICTEPQTDRTGDAYGEACTLMRADLDAAVGGCLAAGATEIVVCDAHDSGSNLSADALPAQVTLVSGGGGALSMMTGVDESFDAALFVGYHARSGTQAAVLEHTYTYKIVAVSCGGTQIGETAINAWVAGALGVPVVFASGDDKLAAEAQALSAGVETVVVKDGLHRSGAMFRPLEAACTAIRESVQRALAVDPRPEPLRWPGAPFVVTFARAHFCDAAAAGAGVRRLDGLSVEISGGDYLETFANFLACLTLADTAGPPAVA
jgi:D-amino peptidase